MPLPSACTGSLLECAKRVAGVTVSPVPRSLNGRLDEWAMVSGAARVRPVPLAPGVPTAVTVTVSIRDPMSSRMVSPAEMFVVELTFLNGRQKLGGLDVFSLLQYNK